jgi:hypothetical protein
LLPIDSMSDDNQILIPSSFIALYLDPGRTRPNAPREQIAGRYELCEDTATLLTEHAPAMVFEQGVSEAQALLRCRQGLLADASVFSEAEAGWITTRLAELLGWALPVA